MSLLQQAAADLRAIVENTNEFGVAIKVEDPDGLSSNQNGLTTDVGNMFDPNTGQMIAGRRASVALSTQALLAAGHTGLPAGASDPSKTPWIVTFLDIHGRECVFMVSAAMPDRKLGLVTCSLEHYRR